MSYRKGKFFILNFFYSIKEFISKYKSYIIISTILILSITSLVIQNIESKSKITINNNEMEINSKDGKIAVYIAGEVLNPGVYYIEENSRIVDLLELCGGTTQLADISDINLAEKLEDSDKIEIPKKNSQIDSTNEDEEIEESDNSGNLININTASKDELKTLKGVGDTLAQNIIDYRKNNKFYSIEDILNVNGIGQSKYEQIKEYICVN